MMPPVDLHIPREELHYRSEYAYRCVEYALSKETIPRLFDSEAEFLLIDFFDLCQHVAVVNYTTCQTYDYTMLEAPSFKTLWSGQQLHFLEIPTCLWYGYVDLYWSNMAEKFNNNIVLSRLNCCGQYITKNNIVEALPERVLYFGNDKYNTALAELERYIISKYNPYVIDVSKYFIADENYSSDVTPVHYEKNYEVSAWNLLRHILLNHPVQRYFDYLPPKVTADLLVRVVSDGDYLKIWQKRERPFVSFAFLDDYFLTLSEGDILNNRLWIASLYRFFEAVELDTFPIKQIALIREFAIWIGKHKTKNDFQKETVIFFQEKARYFEQSPDMLLAEFIRAFEAGDSNWIHILSCLYIMIPDDPQVAMYRSHYILALEKD